MPIPGSTSLGDEPPLRLPGGVEARVHVRGEHTGGAFVLLTDVAPAGWVLPPHRHERESETIHVTAGRLELVVDGRRLELGPGRTAVVPPRALHSSATLGTEPVRRVVVFSPSGMERFFERLARVESAAEALSLAQTYGWSFA